MAQNFQRFKHQTFQLKKCLKHYWVGPEKQLNNAMEEDATLRRSHSPRRSVKSLQRNVGQCSDWEEKSGILQSWLLRGTEAAALFDGTIDDHWWQ